MKTPFFSRNTLYKKPFGCPADNETVTFRLFLPLDCSEAVIALCKDGEMCRYYRFSREFETESDGVWWSCTLGPFSKGLYFYYFEFDTPFGHNVLYKGKTDACVMNQIGEKYVMSVYDHEYKSPDFLCGGIIYQIFPDRFCKDGSCENPFPDRYIYDKFEGTPAFELLETRGGRQLNNDYFCGNLKGITSKLGYLSSLGVSCIYLNPIFEAHSNHRYNTADYMKIDPLLGGEEDFKRLCKKAEDLGIRIILDGVFSHTGEDSVYFNKLGRYGSLGAYQSKESPYYKWFSFDEYPNKYACWWGIKSLPEVKEECEEYLEFITGQNGVAAKWLSLGASGFRLDVADELPDVFLDRFNAAVKREKKDGVIIGEVWEDASLKESYGHRRHYLLGGQLDSVMNYPFYEAVIKFLKGGDGDELLESVFSVIENYPKSAVDLLMNHMGTHDTVRLLTRLGGEPLCGRDRAWQSRQRMTAEQRQKGKALLKLAAVLQYTLPGVPSLYYGDETGAEGYSDPFNRAPFNADGDAELTEFYKKLGAFRRNNRVFAKGEFHPIYAQLGTFAFERTGKNEKILVAVNRWHEEECIALPPEYEEAEIIRGRRENGRLIMGATDFSLMKLS